jgi:RNA-directed DNA polymerase
MLVCLGREWRQRGDDLVPEKGLWDREELLDPETGTPQGGVASPLLANIYLTRLDRAFEALGSRFRLIRYADDCVP